MKYDLTKKQTKGAKRVLFAFASSLLDLLCEKAFEEITVGEICEKADYPRATFYNYFDDKYDLLTYYWYIISINATVTKGEYSSLKEAIVLYFERLYALVEQNLEKIILLTRHNLWDGYFMVSSKKYLTDRLNEIMENSDSQSECPLPQKLLAEHYANTILLVVSKTYSDGDGAVDKTTAKQYLNYLLKGI